MKALFTTLLIVMAILVAAAGATAGEVKVYSNGSTPGDSFTNSTTTSTSPTTSGAAIGASNWYYNNVRNNGVVGINTAYPRSGNGSVLFKGTQGPSGNSSKADIEYYNIVGGVSQSLGTLSNLSSLSYEWYRKSGGTASAWLHPVLRLYVVSPDSTKYGYLVFEREINRDTFGNPVVAPTDQWVADDVLGGNYRMWSTGSNLPFNLNGTNGAAKYYDALRLSDWQSSYGSYKVMGVSAGIGSGWGTFEGGVDNITFGFGTNSTYNFEVVPEPASIIALAGGLLPLLGLRRRSA